MIVILLRSGRKEFCERYEILPDGSVKGTKKSQSGKLGTIVVPAQAIDSITEWAEDSE